VSGTHCRSFLYSVHYFAAFVLLGTMLLTIVVEVEKRVVTVTGFFVGGIVGNRVGKISVVTRV
jgi:hypothetical protein